MTSTAGVAKAASFDCKKAASQIEHMICDDVYLNSFDSQIQEAYAGALDRSTHPEQIKAEQRAWLKERDACGDVKCMTQIYQRRIELLSKISDDPAICAGSGTPDVNACQAEYTRRAERELARYLAAARKPLADDDVDASGRQTNKAILAALDASQKAWKAYRKAECDAVYISWSEGTISGAMYEDCMQTLTKSRTEQVWKTWLTYEDSTPPLLPKPTSK